VDHTTLYGGEFVYDYRLGSTGATVATNLLATTFSSYLVFEEIKDVVGKRRSNQGLYNPSDCDRTTVSVHTKDVPSWTQYNTNDVVTVKRFDTGISSTLPGVMCPLPPDSLWEEFASEAFNDFATQIPEEISIANFSWEFQEIGQLLPKLEKSLSKTISSGYLNLEFGWKPFLGDLNTLTNLLTSVRAKIQHLRDIQGRTTRLGAFRGNVYNPVVNPVEEFSYAAEAVWFRYRLDGYRADFRANAYVYSLLEDLNELSGFVRAMIVALGLTNPLKVIWNAIPYSFVADWFTGLSGRLQSLSVNPFKGTWILSRHCTSLRATSSVIVDAKLVAPAIASMRGYYPLGNIVIQRYQRVSGLPVSSGFLTSLTTPTSKQQTLLTALLESGRRH
jgi:hypothetical protein